MAAGATNIPAAGPDSETVIPPKESEVLASSVQHEIDEMPLKDSSVWYKHAKEFPGIKFSNYYTKKVVSSRGDIIRGEGIELQIPGRAIRRGESVEFIIQGCIYGPFELPDDVSLASPVYVITPHYEFQREVTLLLDSLIQLQCVDSDLVFLTSPANPEIDQDCSRWKFKISEVKPKYMTKSRVSLELTQLCLLCFCVRRRAPQYEYRVSLHSPLSSVEKTWCRAIFSVSLYHEIFIKNLKVHLDSLPHQFSSTCETPVHLTEEEITLHFQNDPQSQGFRIVADKMKILKSAVDYPAQSWWKKRRASRDVESYPPRICFTITYTKSLPSPTNCQLEFRGIQEHDSFNMSVPPGAIGELEADISTGNSLSRHTKGTFKFGQNKQLTMENLLCLQLLKASVTERKNIVHEIDNPTSRDMSHILFGDELTVQKIQAEIFNEHTLQMWLNGEHGSRPSWKALSEALEWMSAVGIIHLDLGAPLRTHRVLGYRAVGTRDLAKIVKSQPGTPTITTLLNLPIGRDQINVNIARVIGMRHETFRSILLPGCLENISPRDFSERVFQEWVNGRGRRPVSRETLERALWNSGKAELSRHVSSHRGPITMETLLNFPVLRQEWVTVNVVREVGARYFDFGIHLLQDQDPTGAHVRALENELSKNGEEINKRILTEWLSGQGRPVTWATLVEVLNIIGMGELAKMIKETYIIKEPVK